MLATADMFEKGGFEVERFGFGADTKTFFEAAEGKDTLILPLPYSRDGISIWMPLSDRQVRISEVESVCENMTVFGGMIKEHPRWRDYFASEQAKILNAVPTAEGAISIAIENTDFCLWKSRVAIIGFGCVAKALAARLSALGAKVTVIARSAKARAEAESMGCDAFGFDTQAALHDCKIVFGTVPSRVLEVESLRGCRVYIELASAPGCIARQDCECIGIRYIPAPGLPGVIAPRTAGEIIYRCITDEVYA